MNCRVKDVYIALGHVLNSPRAFGLEERMPKTLEQALTRMQQELLAELKDEAEDKDLLERELAQDADTHPYPFTTMTSFALTREDN